MQGKASIPAIRFAGFTDAWEQRKLSSLCAKFTDGDWIEAKDQSPSGVRLIQTGNVGVAEYLDKPTNKKWISVDTFERLHCEEVFPGDILISRLPEPAGRACIVPFLGTKMITAVDCTIVRTADGVSPNFLLQYLSSQMYFDEVNTCLAGGTRQRISRSNLSDFVVPTPATLGEQEAIGAFFRHLDHLITLHQRKYSRLCNVKKSMLEKMFPKDGASMPEIRFAGFTDAWEQRKLGDYCDMYNGDRSSKYPNADDMVSDGIPFINAGDLENGTVNLMICNKISREKYNDLGGAKLQRGDIVYCLRGTLGKNAFIDNFDEGTVASSLVALRPKNINGKYLYFILNSNIEYRQRIVRDEGAAQPNLSAKSVSEYIIPAPSEEEQQQISACFSKLDTLITLHQRELERLQNIKKACLEKMFV